MREDGRTFVDLSNGAANWQHAPKKLQYGIEAHSNPVVRMQMAPDHQGAAIIADAMGVIGKAVFVLDSSRGVMAMSPEAESLVGEGTALRRLTTSEAAEMRQLSDAISRVINGMTSGADLAASDVLIRHESTWPLILEILPLPRRDFSFGFEPSALIVVRMAKLEAGRAFRMLRAAYGLTGAETEIALHLLNGLAPEAIAASRETTISTTRMQIKSIYAKLGVHRQIELVARIGHILY
jgi:DNA-binding CsgD family transcriptional regulator